MQVAQAGHGSLDHAFLVDMSEVQPSPTGEATPEIICFIKLFSLHRMKIYMPPQRHLKNIFKDANH